MSEFQEAKTVAREAIQLKKKKEYNQACNVLLKALEKYPDNNYLKSSLADTYFRQNRLAEAAALAGEVLAEHPENYNALTVKGNIAASKHDYGQALRYFKQAYLLNDSNYLAARLVRTYLDNQESEQALSLCQERLERDGDNSYFKKLQAEVYKRMKQYEQAADLLEDYLTEEADDQFAFKEKIKLKLGDKSPEEGVKELQKLMKLNKYQQNIHLHTLLAEKLQEIGQREQAIKVYEKAQLIDPDNSYVLKNLGLALYKEERWDKALVCLKEVFKSDPNDYYIRSTLQALFTKLEQYQEGMDYFQGIIKETGLNNLWGVYKKLSRGVVSNEQEQD